MSLHFDISKIDGILFISLEGKVLEESLLAEILQKIDSQIKDVKGQVILNLTNLDYINSTGINFFIKVLTKARTQGGDLIFYGIKGSVQTVVKISKMDEVFTITETQDEAINIFKTKA
jgi:anti-sigma B factor antagonist